MAIQQLVMNIDGMHCEKCAEGIRRVTEGVEGVRSAHVSYSAKKLQGEYDDERLSPERIIKQVELLGYKVPEEEKDRLQAVFA